jgi:hypothetical protein
MDERRHEEEKYVRREEDAVDKDRRSPERTPTIVERKEQSRPEMYQSKSESGMVERSGSKCAGREKRKEQRRGEVIFEVGNEQVRVRSVALGVVRARRSRLKTQRLQLLGLVCLVKGN